MRHLPAVLAMFLSICIALSAGAATFREITDIGPWGDYEAFPDVCRLTNGDLFVVFYAGYGHVSNPNDALPMGGAVYGLRSSDQGRTWSEPFVVVDTELDDRDPHVTQLGNGDLLVSYFNSRYYEEDGKRKREAEVCVARSTDMGNTWGEPTVVTTPYEDKAGVGRQVYVSGPPLQLEGSHVVLPIYHGETPGHYVTAVVHSDDFGKTWTKSVPVDEDESLSFSYGFCEASITRLGDGRLIILMRPGMHQAFSSDEGYTWSKAEKLPHLGDAPTVFRTSTGMLLVAHRKPGTSLMISADDGKTWGHPWQIDTVGGAYPGLAELDDGSILCIYYEEGQASDIRQAIFSVEPGIRLDNLDDRWPTPPPPGQKMDLQAMYKAGKLKIETDMKTDMDGKAPGITGAFDGNIEYFHAAWKSADSGDATYSLELADEAELTGIGLCLKRSTGLGDWPESADVYLSADGKDWGKPVASYKNAVTNSVNYVTFDQPAVARFVKIHVTDAKGWRAVTEVELYTK